MPTLLGIDAERSILGGAYLIGKRNNKKIR